MSNSNLNRRQFLQGAAASLVFLHFGAHAVTKGQKRNFIWVLLRGGMDSLHAVVPAFDSDLMMHRRALVEPIAENLLPLDGNFALHPAFKNLHTMYKAGEMTPVVAVATPYRNRSHFDAQDLLETGKKRIDHDSGWLGRALEVSNMDGLAISRSVPITMRGVGVARTWYPSKFSDVEDDTIVRLMNLYENDDLLSSRLQEATETNDMIGDMGVSSRSQFTELAKNCAILMSDKNGPNCAMLEMGGWDTHNNQVGRLNRQYTQLDEGIHQLKNGLGDAWKDTVVVIATEFGRTVRINGTAGTDHGTASNLFLCGGAVKGGKVFGDWPGLNKNSLYENRDLQPTSDSFDWIASLMAQHWNFNEANMAKIFPDSTLLKHRLV